MKLKKILSSILITAFLLAFVSSAIAEIAAFTGYYESTQIYKYYAFGPYSKPEGDSTVSVNNNSLIYATGTKSYHYARPQSSSGAVYGSRAAVYRGNTRTFSLNSTGTIAGSFRLKVYNAYYLDNENSSVKMGVHGLVLY